MIVKLTKKQADPWSGVKFYKNCSHSIGSYYKRSGQRYTGLEEEDAERLGKKLGYNLHPTSDFWDTFGIKLLSEKEELTINTDDAWGEFQYKFLKNHKRVAKSLKDITPGKDWVLIDEQKEANTDNEKSRLIRKAFVEFDKLTPEQMRKCLRLYGVNSTNSNNELAENTLFNKVNEDPSKFLTLWVNNDDKEVHYLIEEAVAKNILRKNKTIYYYGTDVLGHTLDDTIAFLKEPKNNDIRIAIMSLLEGRSVLNSSNTIKESKGESERLLEQIEAELKEVKKKTPAKKTTKKTE